MLRRKSLRATHRQTSKRCFEIPLHRNSSQFSSREAVVFSYDALATCYRITNGLRDSGMTLFLVRLIRSCRISIVA